MTDKAEGDYLFQNGQGFDKKSKTLGLLLLKNIFVGLFNRRISNSTRKVRKPDFAIFVFRLKRGGLSKRQFRLTSKPGSAQYGHNKILTALKGY